MLYILPALREAYLDRKVCTVVVTPLRALQRDVARRMTQSGIVFVKFQKHMSSTQLDTMQPFPRVVLVSVELLESSFLNFMLLNREVIRRVVVDEAHQLMDTFRPDMAMVLRLCQLGVPTVLMSATFPVTMQTELMRRNNWTARQVRIIRSDTTMRSNLRLSVEHVSDSATALALTATMITQEIDRNFNSQFQGGRALVFGLTREGIEFAAEWIQRNLPQSAFAEIRAYHGGGSLDDESSYIYIRR